MAVRGIVVRFRPRVQPIDAADWLNCRLGVRRTRELRVRILPSAPLTNEAGDFELSFVDRS